MTFGSVDKVQTFAGTLNTNFRSQATVTHMITFKGELERNSKKTYLILHHTHFHTQNHTK